MVGTQRLSLLDFTALSLPCLSRRFILSYSKSVCCRFIHLIKAFFVEKYADLFQQGRFQLLFAKTYLVHVTPIITQGVCEVIPYVNVLKFSHL